MPPHPAERSSCRRSGDPSRPSKSSDCVLGFRCSGDFTKSSPKARRSFSGDGERVGDIAEGDIVLALDFACDLRCIKGFCKGCLSVRFNLVSFPWFWTLLEFIAGWPVAVIPQGSRSVFWLRLCVGSWAAAWACWGALSPSFWGLRISLHQEPHPCICNRFVQAWETRGSHELICFDNYRSVLLAFLATTKHIWSYSYRITSPGASTHVINSPDRRSSAGSRKHCWQDLLA